MEKLCAYNIVLFDRGFTGHEHLDDFGLINMNGRMYDPMMSAFLSPDNYMQNPNCQQGFNRYAYCMYNPLKYVDPIGEQYFGWDPGLAYRIEQEMRGIVLSFWHQCYDISMASHYATIAMANCLFSHGQDTHGNGSGNHGSPGGVDRKVICEAHQSFNDSQRDNINSDRSKCAFGSLGSTCDIWDGALNTQQWIDKAHEYGIEIIDTDNMPGFVKSAGYEYEEIYIYQICDAMNEGYVVNVWCTLTNENVSDYHLNGTSHDVNISDCIMYDNGDISISFSDFRSPGFMVPANSNINPPNSVFNYSKYTNQYGHRIISGIRFFMIKPNWL